MTPAARGVREDQVGDRLAHGDRRDREHPPPLAFPHLGNRLVTHGDRRQAVELERVDVLLDRRRRERPGRWSPALATRMSTPPSTSRASRTKPARAVGVDTSATIGTAPRPIRAAASSTASDRRLHNATCTPSWASASATAYPSPCDDAATAARFRRFRAPRPCSSSSVNGTRRIADDATCRPVRKAMISAQIATAVSSGVRAPTSSPMGDITRAISASESPCSRRRSARPSCVRREPIAPRYPTSVFTAATIAGTSNLWSCVRTHTASRGPSSAPTLAR